MDSPAKVTEYNMPEVQAVYISVLRAVMSHTEGSLFVFYWRKQLASLL